MHYTWPSIRKDVKAHVDQCKLCAELMPSKSQARSSGLNIPLENLKPMDWLSTDLAQKTLSNGKKVNFLIIVDRASGFIRVYQLRGTKTRNVIEALQEFNDTYVGPPYWLMSDGGPQFAGANAAIKSGQRRHLSSKPSPLPSIPNATERLRVPYRQQNGLYPMQSMTLSLYKV